ncbi:MAG: hypothetical protein KJ011_18350 [Burkholderiaceae bacterium]|nr:hypothetical protein [Burkholderiaceae bacterium]
MPSETDRPDAAAGRFSGVPLVLLRLLGAVPLRLLQGLGALAGVVACLLSSSYRRKLRANLRQAGYASTADALRAAAQAGRMVGELPFVWYGAPAAFARRVFCDDLPVLEAAEATGAGIVFLTPHLGAFEAAARFYARRAPLTVLYKPPKQAWLQPLLAECLPPYQQLSQYAIRAPRHSEPDRHS